MSFNSNITPGRPPLLWSDVHEAFVKVNENFDILVATIGNGSGLTPLNFETLDTNLSPTDSNVYQLGNSSKQWKSVHTAEWSAILGSELNGLWAGSAQIKGVGLTVNLPENSTIGGDPNTGIGVSLIIDPDKTFFKEIQVDNNLSVVATTFGDTVNLLSGSGISLFVNSGADSIEIDNTGILNVTAGSGISSSTVSGVANIVNTGVRSLTSTTALPSGRTPGAGINISASTGDSINVTNTGVLAITSGVGITVSTDVATGQVQITNSAPVVNSFAQVEINGDSGNRLLADAVSDVLNINSGQGITLTKNTATDSLTITVDPVFDLRGSVFGDDSTKIVDAVENKVYAEFFGNLTGDVIGNADTATTASKATTVTLVATNSTAATHYVTFVDTATGDETVRTDTNLTYNPGTNTLGATNLVANAITTPDSSALTINVPVNMFSGLSVGSDIIFADGDIQTTAYSGGVGHMMMIDTNRTDTYTEVGTADKPFKTFAAAIAAAEANPATAFTFVMMGCTVAEDVDFTGTTFTQITISTACRSVITGNVTIAGIPTLSQLFVRNIEISGTFTLTGDGTSEQMNSCNFYDVTFSGPVNITATNATAFFEASFFDTVDFTNLSYLYINGAQFNDDWTITADDTGVIPSRGINPGTGGSISIVFGTIANNVYFVKGGTASYVFQPHMTRLGRTTESYTIPAGWIVSAYGADFRGTWTNNGSMGLKISGTDNRVLGTAPSYSSIIGGDRVIADLAPANSTGVEGDRAGMIAVGGGYLYVCTADWASPGSANIWTRTALTAGAW